METILYPETKSVSVALNRFGLHYLPDTIHYRERDLALWLPVLQSLGIRWLTLLAPASRAIPEAFLRGLVKGGIQPVLHLDLPLEGPESTASLPLLFSQYARWGVRYVALFDRPNIRSSWPAADWARGELVERFLDYFIPPAMEAVRAGLNPIFPPLEPGGDYWDTAFLRAALRGLLRRAPEELIGRMVLGVYAWAGDRSLDWGCGGPERWPSARPYHTPQGAQDQCGFRIFDWYLALAEAEWGFRPNLIVLRAGPNGAESKTTASNEDTERAFTMLRWTCNDPDLLAQARDPIPEEVLAVNFWLLAAPAGSPYAKQAWYTPDGELAGEEGIALRTRQWASTRRSAKASLLFAKTRPAHPISHYVLLPRYEWGADDWHLDQMRTFLRQHSATAGFSVEEAVMARRVTVIGGVQAFPQETIGRLKMAGCQVERLAPDGTVLPETLE